MDGEQGEFVSREEVQQALDALTAKPVEPGLPLRRAVCKFCGLPIQWARTREGKAIPMQPGQFPAWAIPVDHRWTFTEDRIHHAPWLGEYVGEKCRVIHMDVCPGRPEPEDATMRELRERLWARAVAQNGGIPVQPEGGGQG